MGFYNVINRALLQQNQPEDISQVLANLDAIASVVNGGLDNNNISPTAAITASRLAGYPADATKSLKGDGTWAALGGVDYEGAWDVAFPYIQGDVVTYQGVTYVAVNPSTGVPPPAGGPQAWTLGRGLTLPASPVDGQEYILTDSLTAPTYQWRFRYNAGSVSAYKWEYIGGIPILARFDADVALPAGSGYADPADTRITIPRSGDYIVHAASHFRATVAGQIATLSIRDATTGTPFLYGWAAATSSTDVRIGVTGDMLLVGQPVGGYVNNGGQVNAGAAYYGYRTLSVIPKRII